MAKQKQTRNGVAYALRDRKAKTIQPIHLIVTFDNSRIKISTGLKVNPDYWDKKKYRVRNVIGATDKDEINGFLGRLEAKVKSLCTTLRVAGILTKTTLKEQIEEFINPVKQNDSQLFAFIERFIEKAPERTHAGSSKLIGKITILRYKRTYQILRDFAKGIKKPLDFESIDLDFYHDFTKYLNDLDYSTNTVGGHIKTLKVFMNAALEQGKTANRKFKSPRFKIVSEEIDNVYLTEKELQHIAELDLSDKPRLDRVRDLFLIGCYTGLRFGDLSSLTPDHIRGDFITIEQAKTGQKVVIPCLPVVKGLLAKYNGALPTAISNQKMNDYIKEVCELAELNELERKKITKGGKEKIKPRDGWGVIGVGVEKWRLVGVHTARRSFATNMYLRGIPSLSIMAITGHRTEKAFRKYIKLDEAEHAQVFQMAFEKSEKRQG